MFQPQQEQHEKPLSNGDIIDGFSDLSEQASFLSYRAYAAGFIAAERYYNIEPPEYSSYDASQMWSEWLDKEGVDYECHSVNVDVNTAVLELIARDSVPEGAMTTTIQSMTISQTVKEILSA